MVQHSMVHDQQAQPSNDLRTAADNLTPRIKEIVQQLYAIQGRLFQPVPSPAGEKQSNVTGMIMIQSPLDASIGSAHGHLDDADEVIKVILDRL